MIRTDPSQMTIEDIESEIDHLQDHFDECERIGQGISTKEGGRMRRLSAELEARTTAAA